ncbi:hypothetical protein CAPTEDRAFT_186827 [Capitella teleta]|uniref:Mitochondrial splicing suppressor 51-like C-terminal domain-containing protein n=1 Tax=Capitella teleta TaxID=283909 RepID=R7UC92_CAPTE|nr:hypothetical protein CAPTEDRAFT_186827 [Capitella teleta]|eukprot:ELU03975.1 hypothetical protein CAPTEDRAFT_186827 [Capitella teleta]
MMSASPCFNPVDVEQEPQAHQEWCHRMSLYKSFPMTAHAFAFSSGELASISSMDELIALPKEAEILRDGSVESPEKDLTSWAEYYQWRGLPETSPICILLQFPLTLYHIIRCCLPKYREYIMQPSTNAQCLLTDPEVNSRISEKKSLTVHLLGVEKEADLLPLFNELTVLLPNLELNLHFFGPGLSKKVHGRVHKHRSIKIILRRKLYHKSTLAASIPDLVIGFNAGLAAYQSWQPTIECLKNTETPVFFTDYCRLSVDLSRKCLQSSRLGNLSDVTINPFYSPIREFNPEHLMPCFSNAFLFRLIK